MGLGRAGDGTLGIPAVRLLAATLLLLLGGCHTVPQITGLIAGGVSGGATANPAIGFGVGVATVAVTDYTLKRVNRSWHQGEQDAIAATAGPLDAGGRAPWQIKHSLPIGDEHGDLAVVRQIDNPLAPCKQVVFSVVEDDTPPAWYSADICRHGEAWKWASAEPAVARWGYLQ
jgi:hypothetical protein